MSIPYYNKQKIPTYDRLRNWSVHQFPPSERNKENYKIYYIDSEWTESGNGNSVVNTVFTGLQTAFNDGSQWKISAEDANSTGTFTFIVVRLKDRVVKKCVGVASGEKLTNNALWTVTDVTGKVWYEELRKLRLLGNI